MSIASALKSLNMAPEMHRAHISVCVCTYKRPEMLRHLLTELGNLKTENQFTYSILVADNDEARSAQDTVEELRRLLPVSIRYFCEPRRNIALARNKVIENVQGEYVALIDDDEFPTETWLLTLFNTCNEYKVDGVLGPVVRHFDETPPAWFKKSKIYDRESNPTGEVVRWEDSRTGNALLRRLRSGRNSEREKIRIFSDARSKQGCDSSGRPMLLFLRPFLRRDGSAPIFCEKP